MTLSEVLEVNQRDLVAVLTAFALSLALISFPIRLYVKGTLARIGGDDGFYFGALVSISLLGIAHSSDTMCRYWQFVKSLYYSLPLEMDSGRQMLNLNPVLTSQLS